MTPLLISSDSHAQVSHDAVKAHLASKFHDEYDGAVAAFQPRMAKGAGRVNQAWQSDRKRDEAASSFRLRNMTRPGHSDGVARLADMDTDGVQQEVIYSEVSAFRYIRDLAVGQSEATVRVQRGAARVRRRRPDPSHRVVPDPDPRHRRRGHRGAARHRAGRQVTAAAGLPARGRAPRLLPRALRPALRAHPGVGTSDLLPHRAQHDARRPRRARPHAGQRGDGADGGAHHR